METGQINILDLSYAQLQDWLTREEEPVSHAGRIFRWIYRGSAFDFEQMNDLSSSLKAKLSNAAVLVSMTPLEERESADGQTRKLLFRLDDGKTIESTLMYYHKTGVERERNTVCISSQVGCPIGCGFCATGQQGFERNLRPGEIVEQVLYFQHYLDDIIRKKGEKPPGRRVTNVVFMGMGEPLANFENVRQAINIIKSPQGMNLGVRQITLSTSGLVPRILELGREDLYCELAISLHAATDELRDRLVPINKKYPLSQLIDACKEYAAKTGRHPFFEYALFQGVNDSLKDAEELVKLLKDFRCSINLILGNPTSGRGFAPSSIEKALQFQNKLISAGFRTMIRVSKGADIEAGCGQLRSRWLLDNTR